MNKSELAQSLAERENLTFEAAKQMVDTIFELMTETLASGGRVEIRGFGSFKVKAYDGYNGRNPKTGDVIQVKPKKLPVFKVGKGFKDRLNGR